LGWRSSAWRRGPTRSSPKRGTCARIIADANFIFTATIESVDPDKPSLVLTFDEKPQRQGPFRRLPINLKVNNDRTSSSPAAAAQRSRRKLPSSLRHAYRDGYVAFVYTKARGSS